MNGMRAGDKILHVMVQTNHANGVVNGRQSSGNLEASSPASMATCSGAWRRRLATAASPCSWQYDVVMVYPHC